MTKLRIERGDSKRKREIGDDAAVVDVDDRREEDSETDLVI